MPNQLSKKLEELEQSEDDVELETDSGLRRDISISTTDNVSTNPGFESCLGIW